MNEKSLRERESERERERERERGEGKGGDDHVKKNHRIEKNNFYFQNIKIFYFSKNTHRIAKKKTNNKQTKEKHKLKKQKKLISK